MKKSWAILIWGVLVFAIGTYLDKVREMLMMGQDPKMTAVFQFAVGFLLVVVVVVAGQLLKRWLGRNRLRRNRLGQNRLGPGDWFMIGAVAWLIQGGYMWAVEPHRTLDLVLHGTFFVILYLHAAVVVTVVFAVIGAIYISNRAMNKVMGYLHFWVSYAALYVVLWMESYKYVSLTEGTWGFGIWEFQHWQTSRVVGWAYTVMAMLLVAVQLLFVVNLFLMVFSRGRRRAANGRFR